MRLISRLFLSAAALACLLPSGFAQPAKAAKGEYIAYVGTYTRPEKSKGIYAWRFQPATGKLTAIGLVGETVSPSFLAVHPNHKFLYAVNEISNFQGSRTGSVSAFAMDTKTGQLKLLNTVTSRGGGPCHLALDPSGKWLYVANYNSGNAAEFPVHDDGTLGEASAFVQHAGSSVNRQRQSGPHAHETVISPDGKSVFVPDLGLDQILSYKVGGLTPNDPPFLKIAPGNGPRHFAFTPNGKFAYVMTEMTASVIAFKYAGGKFEELQTLPTVDTAPNMSGAEIAVHPNGKFVYTSTRGVNSIGVFAIDAKKGKLTPVERTPSGGKTPRNFTIDPTGAYMFVAHQDSDNVVVFKIDAKTGKLTPSGDILEAFAAVCVAFVPAQ
ncbi:MAG: lactonase family protein [Candidatus Solibacter sp.]|nr:lactonase family protein [Candidatus Solibacter sp.]